MSKIEQAKRYNVMGTVGAFKIIEGAKGTFLKGELNRASQKRSRKIRIKIDGKQLATYQAGMAEGGAFVGKVLDFFGYYVNDGKPYTVQSGKTVQPTALKVLHVRVAETFEEKQARWEAWKQENMAAA